MKRYGCSSRIALIFLSANFCMFSYSPAMQLPPDVQQQIINAPPVRSAVQEVQRGIARASWQGKTVDIKQALAQSEKFQSALSAAIDAEYKNLLRATEQIAQTGSGKDAKAAAATRALKKIPKDKSSSFSRYTKIAAIAALAAVVVAYGSVNWSEQQGSSVGSWTHKGVPAPVAIPQGAPANSSVQGVVLPEVRALVQQGGGEGAAFSAYAPAPKTPEISKNFPDVVGQSGALFTHKETSKTLESALADVIKMQERAKEQLLLVDVVGDLSGGGFSGVLFATVDSNEATPNDKRGWVYYFKPGSGLRFAEWSYKFDLNAWFNKETFHIGQERALAVTGQEEEKYVQLLENLRKKLPPYKINQNISPKFVKSAFARSLPQPLGLDPIEWLNYFACAREVSLKSYERAFAQSFFDDMFTSVLNSQPVDRYAIALFDLLNGEYNEVIIAIESGEDAPPYRSFLDRAGWMYYKKSGELYFMGWLSNSDAREQLDPAKKAAAFRPGKAEKVIDPEGIGHYEKLYEALKAYSGKSFKFSELPFEKIYGTN